MKQELVILAVFFSVMSLSAEEGLEVGGEKVDGIDARLVQVTSTYDGTKQPCFFWAPKKALTEPVPLIVGFHTWSQDWRGTVHYKIVVNYVQKMGWAMVGPNARGANDHPEACGSNLAVQDVVDAVNYAKAKVKIDANRVYVIGGSGGGHLTLLMAGRHPEIWAGAVAFCPITDIARWHADSLLEHPGRGKGYARMIEQSCGGTPAEKPEECLLRSPLTHLANARRGKVPIYIATGIHDGWKGSVPVGHAIRAFNILADLPDRISEADIAFIEANEKVPEHLAFTGKDPYYAGKNFIHLRRTSANVCLTIFEGGHSGNGPAGFNFLSRQVKGSAADFSLPLEAQGSEEQLSK